jgi:FtsX extracellular domain
VRNIIRQSRDVAEYAYLDHQDAYAEFSHIFRKQPDLINGIAAGELPVSFRVVLRHCSAQESLIQRLGDQPGVSEAVVGDGLPHALAVQFARQQSGTPPTLPADRIDPHCGYHQPTGPVTAHLTITGLITPPPSRTSFRYDSSNYTVRAGIIQITLISRGGESVHGGSGLAFDDPTLRGFVLMAPSGPIRGKVRLRTGTYTIHFPGVENRPDAEASTITVR